MNFKTRHHIDANLPIFVYGTLKRGMSRESAWPYLPLNVETAYVVGRLFELGPYPAMIAGPNWIQGELWSFPREQLAKTLAAIDAIEGFTSGNEGDLYRRVVVRCQQEHPDPQELPFFTSLPRAEPSISAYTYYYADDLSSAFEITPNDEGICLWTPRANR